MITIDKITFGFTATNEKYVYELYAKWDDFCRDIIEKITDEVISPLDREDVKRNIGKIELTIGNIPEEHFFDLFPVRFREELEYAVSLYFRGRESTSNQVEVLRHESNDKAGEGEYPDLGLKKFEPVEIIQALASGRWKQLCNSQDYNLQSELYPIVKSDTVKMARVMQRSFREPTVLMQMILYLDNDFFSHMLDVWLECVEIQLTEKQEALFFFAKEYPYLFLQFLQKNRLYGPKLTELIGLINWKDLNYPSMPLSLRQSTILQQTIKQLPADIRPEWILRTTTSENQTIRKEKPLFMQSGLPAGKFGWLADESIGTAEKRRFLKEFLFKTPSGMFDLIHSAEYAGLSAVFIEVMNEPLILQIIEILCKYRQKANQADCWRSFCDWVLVYTDKHILLPASPDGEENRIQLHSPERTDKKQTIADTASFYTPEQVIIGNAGLVLLTPWFPKLFSMLELLDEENRDFKNAEARKRAVFIMQRMVTFQDREYAGKDLALNRLLANYPSDAPLPPKIELTGRESESINSMLSGVKANWPQMANTLISSFQHGFIQRPGMLEIQEEKTVLTVEPRSYDLLLDSLPWSYQLVRFPWLKDMIYVRWREK